MRNVNYINGVEGVVTGGTATVNIPVDRRYHALKIFVTATGIATAELIVSKVRLNVNGTYIRDLTPAQIHAISTLNGLTNDVLCLDLFLSEPWRASVAGEESTSWDMFGQTKFTAEISFISALTGLTCQVQASYDYGRNTDAGKPFLAIVRQLSQTYNAPAGSYDIVTIPVTFPIQRIHLQPAAGVVSSVEVYRGSEKIHEGTVAQNTRFLADYGMVGAAFAFPIVFDFDQQISSPLVVQNQGDLLVRPVVGTAGSFNVLTEARAPAYN